MYVHRIHVIIISSQPIVGHRPLSKRKLRLPRSQFLQFVVMSKPYRLWQVTNKILQISEKLTDSSPTPLSLHLKGCNQIIKLPRPKTRM